LAKDIQIRGTVVCLESEDIAGRPASNILIVPHNFPEKSYLTNDDGLYAISVSGRLINRNVILHYRNSIKDLMAPHRFFISKDRIEKGICILPTVELDYPCEMSEEPYLTMRSELYQFQQHPEEKLQILEKGLAGAGGIGVLTLASLIPFVGVGAGGGGGSGGHSDGGGDVPIFQELNIQEISKKEVADGRFISYGLFALSENMGFNYTPQRDLTEAVFWNPSAIANAYHSQITALSNLKGIHKFSGAFTIGDRFGLGMGYLVQKRREEREAQLEDGAILNNKFETHDEGLFASASIGFPSYFERPFSLGLTLKRISQRIEVPNRFVTQASIDGEVISTDWGKHTKQRDIYDIDISATLEATNALTFGAVLVSALDQKMENESGDDVGMRMYGVGASFQRKRYQVGVDMTLPENPDNNGIVFGFGINVIPFNNVQVHCGYTTEYRSFSSGIRLWYFSYTYSNNDVYDENHFLGLNIKF
jgi:hypothetical protein